jgi:Xaa-Pro aminopeptidase
LEYTIYDGLVHGFGVDILPPTLGRADVEAAKEDGYAIEDPTVIEENMAVVVQPNPITTDERYGVQTGNLVVVRADGPEVLQEHPIEFVRV